MMEGERNGHDSGVGMILDDLKDLLRQGEQGAWGESEWSAGLA